MQAMEKHPLFLAVELHLAARLAVAAASIVEQVLRVDLVVAEAVLMEVAVLELWVRATPEAQV
jgi:hypothetical protein